MMSRKEEIKNILLKVEEIEMLKYSINSKIIELSNRIEDWHGEEYMIEIWEAEMGRYSYLYEKLDEALL